MAESQCEHRWFSTTLGLEQQASIGRCKKCGIYSTVLTSAGEPIAPDEAFDILRHCIYLRETADLDEIEQAVASLQLPSEAADEVNLMLDWIGYIQASDAIAGEGEDVVDFVASYVDVAGRSGNVRLWFNVFPADFETLLESVHLPAVASQGILRFDDVLLLQQQCRCIGFSIVETDSSVTDGEREAYQGALEHLQNAVSNVPGVWYWHKPVLPT